MTRPAVGGVIAAVLATGLLALAGCGDDGVESPPTVGATPLEPAPGLQVRPVLGPADGRECDDSGDPAFPGNPPADEEATACDLAGDGHRLGPASVVGGVERVRRFHLPGMPGRGLAIRLEHQAARDLADLARSASSSDARVAVVLDGIVLTSPTVAGTVGGRLLMVAGDLTARQAQRYAARLTP